MQKLIATAVLLLWVPMLASAQNADHQYRGQGYFFFGLTPRSPVVKHVGGGGELFLYKGFGMGAEAGYAHWGMNYAQAWIASGDLSYHFGRNAERSHIDPFALIGVTGYFPTSYGRGEPAGNFGGGVNVWLKERAALRLEVRDHIPSDGGPPAPGGFHLHYISFRVGMTFR